MATGCAERFNISIARVGQSQGVLMNTMVVASSAQDAQAMEAVKEHHAELAGALALHVEALVSTAIHGDLPAAATASKNFLQWCNDELVPHALAEEASMYPKAQEDPTARLLIEAMLAEHRDILALIEAVQNSAGSARSS